MNFTQLEFTVPTWSAEAPTSRPSRIRELIARIERGDGFHAADLAAALGMQAWTAYQQEKRSMPRPPAAGQVAASLARYRELVRQADALARNIGQPRHAPTRRQRFLRGHAARSATREYERALEWLQDLAAAHPEVAGYFDRPLGFGQGGDLTPSTGGVPRLHGSRSEHAISGADAGNLALVYLRRALADLNASRL